MFFENICKNARIYYDGVTFWRANFFPEPYISLRGLDEDQECFVESYLPNYKIGIMHLAAGIWKGGNDMRIDKSIKIGLDIINKRCSEYAN